MSFPRGGFPGPRFRLPVGAAVLVALTILGAVPASGATTFAGAARPSNVTSVSGLTASLSFSGFTTTGAGSPSSALTVSPGSVSASFHWDDTARAQHIPIAQAQIAALVFGFSAFTRVQVLQPANSNATGWVNLSSDFSIVRFLAEGVYQVVGSLTAQDGSTVWQESFYVHVVSTYHLVVINIVLILIAVYEVYNIAKLGSTRTYKKPETSPTPPEAVPEEMAKDAGKEGP
ncbi:MAG: hypothetical protein L3K15_05625 [Thermoplasmata archaeon]|nr:hypothetical protein [Thermoplasmata archaeon]